MSKSDRKIVIGARGSKLSLWQANWVKDELVKLHSGLDVELKIVKTTGDIDTDRPLPEIGGKGLFTEEIEKELLKGKIDLAVHSMKDLPTTLPPQLCIGAVPKRGEARDALISKNGLQLSALPHRSKVGTSSLRRKAFLLRFRPDLQVIDLRGNLDTRLLKLEKGGLEAVILAGVGLERMGWGDKITEYLPVDRFLPAAGQGAIAIEARKDDKEILELLAPLEDIDTKWAVTAEREVLKALKCGCQVPVGVHAKVEGVNIFINIAVLSRDGRRILRDSMVGVADDAPQLGHMLGQRLLDKGAETLILSKETVTQPEIRVSEPEGRAPSYGKVYLVGAGPGDPKLITIGGLERLHRADVVVYDYLVNEKLLDETREGAEKIYVGKKADQHTLSQNEINKLLVEKAKEGKEVVRLKGGDPFLFGRGGEEALFLVENEIEFEIVPGVTSAIAVPAYAGIPVTHRDLASAVTFITGHEDPTKVESKIDWNQIASISGTVVFLMGLGNLSQIVDELIKFGRPPTTSIAIIRWGTKPDQQTVTGTLTDIVDKVKEADLKPPVIMVMGDVVNLREKLNWFERKPLFGKTIVVTRARQQASELTIRLEELGAQIIEFPTIEIADPDDWGPLDEALRGIASFDWIVFTSVNGVEAFFRRATELDSDIRELKGVKIASIGPATTDRLQDFHIKVDYQPPKYVAESLVEGLKEIGNLAGAKILLPRADIAREYIREELGKLGADVTEVVAYRTLMSDALAAPIIKMLEEGRVSMITFTSSSTVMNLVMKLGQARLPDLLKGVKIASIGPITSEKATQLGLKVDVEAKEYTIPGLIEAVLSLLS